MAAAAPAAAAPAAAPFPHGVIRQRPRRRRPPHAQRPLTPTPPREAPGGPHPRGRAGLWTGGGAGSASEVALADLSGMDGREELLGDDAADADLAADAARQEASTDVSDGLTFCDSRSGDCVQGSTTLDMLQNEEGVAETSAVFMFKPPPGTAVTDYEFSVRSSNQRLLPDSNIDRQVVQSTDASGDAVANVTVGLVMSRDVGETAVEVVATPIDALVSSVRQGIANESVLRPAGFVLNVAVGGIVFTQSDLSVFRTRDGETQEATEAELADGVDEDGRLSSPSSRMLGSSDHVAEAVMYDNTIAVTSYESLVRNQFVYVKTNAHLRTFSMREPVNVSSVVIEFDRETYARQINWSPELCRVAPSRPGANSYTPRHRGPANPDYSPRPKPEFLKGIDPKKEVPNTSPPCGISFSYDGSILGLRFNPYRVGSGSLTIHFSLDGFVVNGMPATFTTALNVKIGSVAPPVFTSVHLPDDLDANGGDEVSAVGYNLPAVGAQSLVLVVKTAGKTLVWPEDPALRTPMNAYDTRMVFVAKPGQGTGEVAIRATRGKVTSQVSGGEFSSADDDRHFKSLVNGSPSRAVYRTMENAGDSDLTLFLTFGWVDVPMVDVLRKLSQARAHFARAVGLPVDKITALDVNAGSFSVIDGRTGSTAAGLRARKQQQRTREARAGGVGGGASATPTVVSSPAPTPPGVARAAMVATAEWASRRLKLSTGGDSMAEWTIVGRAVVPPSWRSAAERHRVAWQARRWASTGVLLSGDSWAWQPPTVLDEFDGDSASIYAAHQTVVTADMLASAGAASRCKTYANGSLLSVAAARYVADNSFFADMRMTPGSNDNEGLGVTAQEEHEAGKLGDYHFKSEQQVSEVRGVQVRMSFFLPGDTKDAKLAQLEEYLLSGRGIQELGAEVHLVGMDDGSGHVWLATGVISVVALTSMIATVVAAAGVQIGATLGASLTAATVHSVTSAASAPVASADSAAHAAQAGAGAANTGPQSGSTNPISLLFLVQQTAARGQINAQGLTSPYLDVAAKAQVSFLRAIPGFLSKDDAGSVAAGSAVAVRYARGTKSVQNFYDLLGTQVQSLFVSQMALIGILLTSVVGVHVLFWALTRKRERVNLIVRNVLPRLEVLAFNIIFMGVYIGGFSVLTTSDTSAGIKVAAVALILLFGVCYPAVVLYVLLWKVRPNLNAVWLANYFSRYVLRGGWSRVRRFTPEDLRAIEASWKTRSVEDPASTYWFVERKNRRFAGLWCTRSPVQARFGDLFEKFRGQYYGFYFFELVMLAAEGAVVGSLSQFPEVQAAIVVGISVFNLLFLLWLLPYNDVLEQLVQLGIGMLQVVTSVIIFYLVPINPVDARAKFLSSVILWVNITGILAASSYALFAAGEIMYHNRHRIVSWFVRHFTAASSRLSSSLSRSSGTSSALSSMSSADARDLADMYHEQHGDDLSDMGDPAYDGVGGILDDIDDDDEFSDSGSIDSVDSVTGAITYRRPPSSRITRTPSDSSRASRGSSRRDGSSLSSNGGTPEYRSSQSRASAGLGPELPGGDEPRNTAASRAASADNGMFDYSDPYKVGGSALTPDQIASLGMVDDVPPQSGASFSTHGDGVSDYLGSAPSSPTFSETPSRDGRPTSGLSAARRDRLSVSSDASRRSSGSSIGGGPRVVEPRSGGSRSSSATGSAFNRRLAAVARAASGASLPSQPSATSLTSRSSRSTTSTASGHPPLYPRKKRSAGLRGILTRSGGGRSTAASSSAGSRPADDLDDLDETYERDPSQTSSAGASGETVSSGRRGSDPSSTASSRVARRRRTSDSALRMAVALDVDDITALD